VNVGDGFMASAFDLSIVVKDRLDSQAIPSGNSPSRERPCSRLSFKEAGRPDRILAIKNCRRGREAAPCRPLMSVGSDRPPNAICC